MEAHKFPWEDGTLIHMPQRYSRSRDWLGPVLLILGIISAVTGGLIAWSMTQ